MVDIAIVPYGGASAGERARWRTAIDAIFFEASSVQAFRDDAHRQAFHWLWLGRYLAEEPEHAFVALDGEEVCGYLVGSLKDPARRADFVELGFFQTFRGETARFPAHLHINVAAGLRGVGVGALLIAAFEAHAAASGVGGVHVVTGRGMRNVRFYARLGFREVARAERNGGEVVMLAKGVVWSGSREVVR